jgi:hypothetical protein
LQLCTFLRVLGLASLAIYSIREVLNFRSLRRGVCRLSVWSLKVVAFPMLDKPFRMIGGRIGFVIKPHKKSWANFCPRYAPEPTTPPPAIPVLNCAPAFGKSLSVAQLLGDVTTACASIILYAKCDNKSHPRYWLSSVCLPSITVKISHDHPSAIIVGTIHWSPRKRWLFCLGGYVCRSEQGLSLEFRVGVSDQIV